MTTNEINIAIAEWCGYTCKEVVIDYIRKEPFLHWTHPDGYDGGISCGPPDYCVDLNAMHKAEDNLRRSPDTFQPGGIGHYLHVLDEMTDEPIRATALQRAEALLRTIGKWKD